ncbi:ABC transporter substrate-binding protein [Pseudomonas sp. CAN2814]|uniref:ABC transporter substrate-binding protein n=1 Tax=Pseudomonas sp. CAN1 TaxID=3046726 RepID=UPI00264A498D|nr:ABC transporter substrate-binding protein [Pseudomonas sp. CAN1]MDN6858952.1 ABC transporter substrate-binding protein [Pseudomonas sp. CAN1]
MKTHKPEKGRGPVNPGRLCACIAVLGAALGASAAMAEQRLEVLHSWVSDSEVKAVTVIKQNLAAKGVTWVDSAVGGMSGSNAQQALRARVTAGDPPAAMQSLGHEGMIWAEQGMLASLDQEAKANQWDAAVPDPLKPFLKQGGEWKAVPVNTHRQNWLWANAKAFEKAGVKPPHTWDELIGMGDKLRAAGYVPLAISDEPWQIGIVFDAILIDLYGADFYKKTAIDLDKDALGSPQMVKVFDTLRQVRGLADNNFPGRDWAVATGMVINGKAAMQFMGDWAKGEFLAKGMKPGSDFLCLETPGKEISFQFVMDTFGMFKVKDPGVQKAQVMLADVTMDKKTQHDFSLIKGSIPARTDVDISDYDSCGIKAAEDRATALKSGALVGAMTHGFASQAEFANVFQDVASKFFVTDMSSQDAVNMLVQGIDNAR